ncbi:MAG: NAD(P)/FAD-dependent oxidoreductase, partial [Solirubrobacterales bacterium]|nr:NAD(P)/FAD-dependent oxidoreductase [Solirubrobacterales bacterium]
MAAGIEELDVVIVGAGISGISMAHQLGLDHPGLSYAIIENRQRIGGTWDLFRYPGIRSDSGMGTFAFSFRPWTGTRHFGTGQEIRNYLEETAAEYGIDRHIRFEQKVTAAAWDSESARWTVTIQASGEGGDTGETTQIRSRFLVGCTGYYR